MLNLENKIIRINNCESTNTYAKELLSKSEPIEGTVIITDKQTKGRGQFGNSWLSQDYKNLTFSIILKPAFLKPSQQFILSKITCIATILTLNNFTNKNFKIKWPNDIFFENKKIAGILIENSISTNKIIDSIIGVGININQDSINKNEMKAISLKNIIGSEIELDLILSNYLINFEKFYYLLLNEKQQEIDNIYQSLLLGVNKERVFIETGSKKKIKGIIKGVNSIGQLNIQVNKKHRFFNLKEIKWIFE